MEKLDAILEAAAQRFAHYGFRRSSIDDIARDVGIAKGSIYSHVQSKEELFLKTVERERTLWNQSNQVAIEGICDPRSKLKALVLDSLRWLDERPLFGRLMMGDPEIGITQDMMNRVCEAGDGDSYDEKKRMIADILRSGVDKGHFRKDLSIITAVTIVVSIFHVHLHNRRMQFIPMDPEEYTRQALRILFEGIRICENGYAGEQSKERDTE